MLQPPYNGPYPVISRTDKVFVVRINGKNVTVSIDRLKPAYIITDIIRDKDVAEPEIERTPAQSSPKQIDARRAASAGPPGDRTGVTTRSSRRVHFPDRLQVGRR